MTHPQVPLSGVSEARVRGILARLKQEDARTRFVFTEVYEASALHEAREADRRRHLGLCLGPLDGVVVSVKDLFDIRGHKTSAGSRLLASHATEALADAWQSSGYARRAGLSSGVPACPNWRFPALGIIFTLARLPIQPILHVFREGLPLELRFLSHWGWRISGWGAIRAGPCVFLRPYVGLWGSNHRRGWCQPQGHSLCRRRWIR